MSDPDGIAAERVLTALRSMPPDQIVEPGVTAGDARTVMETPPAPAGTVHIPDQLYGTAGSNGRPLTMHLYAAADTSERRPGVVFIHGGGFQEGFPEMNIRYANHLAADGYVTASIRYRLSGESPWPAQIEDAKAAVRWMRANADRIGLDPDRLAVAGGSAGGCLAAMVSTTPGMFEGQGGNADVSSHVSAAVLWYPVLDLRPSRTPALVQMIVKKLFGNPDLTDEDAAQASAVTFVDKAPPTLTFTGDADPIVSTDGAIEYHRKLEERGVPNRLIVVPDVGHSFDYAIARWNECYTTMRDFLAEHLAPTTHPAA